MNATLTDRIALVTGGGRGIGQAISLGLAEHGARVAVLARSAAEVHETAGRITARGGQALALPADVADQDQVAAALAAIGQRWGPVQVLINNAAVVWPLGPSPAIDPQQWATAIAINVTAAARLSFMALPGMLERQVGPHRQRLQRHRRQPGRHAPAPTPTPPARPPWKPTPSTSPPNWRAPASPSTCTVPDRSTPPCRPGSAPNHR